ncbi:MAG: papain fold toxin domain-containing protein [Cyanobacteria bacterium J06554_6]
MVGENSELAILTREEIHAAVLAISQEYDLHECRECAAAIQQWLKDNDIRGVHLQIKAVGKIKFIVSSRWSETESIAQNGMHEGVDTHERVFDNLPGARLNREDWANDFDCASGVLQILEIEHF